MNRKNKKTLRFDNDLDAYQRFFDHAWARELDGIVQGSKLDNVVFDLCAEWKGVSNARSIPWFMMLGLKDALESSLNYHPPLPLQVIHNLADKISHNLERKQISLSGKDRDALCSEIRKIESELIKTLKANPYNLDLKEIWGNYLGATEFILAIWMSEINAFGALYFAYENFLIESMKLATDKEKLRTNELSTTLETLLGKYVADRCWNETPIELTRLIRHALVHNGRKPTKALAKYKSKLSIEDGKIVIMAHHTTKLFGLLKERVLLFASEAIKLPVLK